ncbi:MAG: peptidoglycan DD-metalloendopeptidase family protein [Patescibacteria group bacterium]
MTNHKNKIKIICLIFFLLAQSGVVQAETVDEINSQINAKQKQAEELKKQAAIYQKNIKTKQQEATSLRNELSLMDNKIAKAELDIKSTELAIDQTKLENRNIELQIVTKEDDIIRQKAKIKELLLKINQTGGGDAIKIFLLKDKLSEYFQESEYLKNLQTGLNSALQEVKAQKLALAQKKVEMEEKQKQLVVLKNDLLSQKDELKGNIDYKSTLLVKTRMSEQKFTDLFQRAKAEQQQISNDLTALEKSARNKLEQQKNNKKELREMALSWPIPENKIMATFHDPEYPYRYLFEHPAIDVRAKQGTTIRAPADGYVLKTRDAGLGYSYISLIHANNLSTVFGHVSKILIGEEEYVNKGDIIGLSGGMPGTSGAGNLSSGPHLHFEVRINGIPVNPLDYLP